MGERQEFAPVRTVGAPAAVQVQELAKWIRTEPEAAAEWALQELSEWAVELKKRWTGHDEVQGINRLPPVVVIVNDPSNVKAWSRHVYEALEKYEAEGNPQVIGLHPSGGIAPAGGPSWKQVKEVLVAHEAIITLDKFGWTFTCECGKGFEDNQEAWEKHQRARVKELFNG